MPRRPSSMAETRPLGTAADNQHIDVAADARHGRSVAATIGVRSVAEPLHFDLDDVAGVRYQGGLRTYPTPSGVPVTSTSPGLSVRVWLILDSRSPTREDHVARIAVLHDGAVHASLNAQPRRRSPTSSAVTIGPMGPLRSPFLPSVHCWVSFWARRDVRSLNTA